MKVLRLYREYISIRLHLKGKLRLQLFLFDPRLELLFFGLRQWSINFQLVASLFALMQGIIILFLILILYPHCETKLWRDYFPSWSLYLCFFSSLLNLLYVLLLLRIKETFNGCKLEKVFPEEWQADLKALQERWLKQDYSCQKIRFLTTKHIFHMVLGHIQIQLENIWLPNNASTKEIE